MDLLSEIICPGYNHRQKHVHPLTHPPTRAHVQAYAVLLTCFFYSARNLLPVTLLADPASQFSGQKEAGDSWGLARSNRQNASQNQFIYVDAHACMCVYRERVIFRFDGKMTFIMRQFAQFGLKLHCFSN